MENNEFKKVKLKIILEGFDLDNISIDEKSHENILIYHVSYKTSIGPKPFRIRFDKIDGFIRIYDGTRYLKLFGSENYDPIYNRFIYLISLKGSITYTFSHYFSKIKVGSYDFLPVGKRLTLHKSVVNKDKNHYYYKIFVEKCSYQLAKK